MFVSRMVSVVILLSLSTVSCKSEEAMTQRVAPPEMTRVNGTATSTQPDHTTVTLTINAAGSAKFLIDAPLEKVRGEATVFRGVLRGNPRNLAATSGQLDVDLKSLALNTFEDAGKNKTQTEHAQNWLGLGGDVPEVQRTENRWVRFSLESLAVTPNDLRDVPEKLGRRTVEAIAQGALWLHGTSVPERLRLTLSFTGPVDSPNTVDITTAEPLTVSLQEHDVKPRDITGKFLQGALEKVGEKIVDAVQISVSATASAQ